MAIEDFDSTSLISDYFFFLDKPLPVVQKMINIAIMINEALSSSLRTKLTATPSIHMMATLYTDMPTYLESLRAGICTDRVSQAKKAPKSCNKEVTVT